MNNFYVLLLIVISLLSCQQATKKIESRQNIIPQPNEIRINEGYFEINSSTQLIYKGLDKQVFSTLAYFQSLINTASGIELQITDVEPANNYIIFVINSDNINNEEGYEISITSEFIEITASSPKGIFYALQSIRQLLPPEIEQTFDVNNTKWSIPNGYINDYPRFQYRGFNLDVARHFYPVEVIKKQLDLLALYKINVFHWHLTDDQGWRIEIKNYPKLTTIGGKRNKTLLGHAANIPLKYDNKTYEGYYTQEEIKDIVNYAQDRYITIIPEIEMPGHALAALASYPELGCTGGPYEVANRWGSFDDVICPGKESSYVIIRNILSEVAQLFPGKYIHIGGDQSSKIRWRDCQHCQSQIITNRLEDENELENYFIRRIKKIVESLDKKMVGWDEIMTDKDLNNATIVVWQDDAEIKHAVKNKNEIIKSPNNFLYFDHYQSEPQNHPLAIGGYTPLKDVYTYEPLTGDLSQSEAQSVIGLQANCWSEYIANETQLEFMLYPRLCAFSEIAWTTNDHKGWSTFIQKLDIHYKRLSILDVNFFYEVPKPIVDNEQLNFLNSTKLSFQHIADKYETRYTNDGSEPNKNSRLFTQDIQIRHSGTVKAITINKQTGQVSKTVIVNLNKLNILKPLRINGDLQAGLNYTLHEGRFKTVKEIENISKNRHGRVFNSFIPDSLYQEGYGLIFSGYFKSKDKGIYKFAINSDDGSALYINNQLVVNNDGIHGKKVERGAIALDKGIYSVKILFFQTTGHQHLNLKLITPDKMKINLQPLDFYH